MLYLFSFTVYCLKILLRFVCVCVLKASAACKKKERKAVSDDENAEVEADSEHSEKEVAGSLNITDEMKRMLSQL